MRRRDVWRARVWKGRAEYLLHPLLIWQPNVRNPAHIDLDAVVDCDHVDLRPLRIFAGYGGTKNRICNFRLPEKN